MTLHLIDGDHATWSAFAGVLRVLEAGVGASAPHVVEVLGGSAGRARAHRAGLFPPSSRHGGRLFAMAWDNAAEAERLRRRLPGRRAPVPIPPRPTLLASREQARATLGVSAEDRTIALLGRSGVDFQRTDPAILAGVLGLTDRPVTVVVLDGPGPTPGDLTALDRIDRGVRVLTPTAPPWAVIAGCDVGLAFGRGDNSDDTVAPDLAAWARITGTATCEPALDEMITDDARRRRYAGARSLSRALRADVATPTQQPSWPDDGFFEHWLAEALAALVDHATGAAQRDG